jgi:thioredoxin reductase (NADPH)
VSGEDLALRAYTQAWNFGADYVYGHPATALRVQGAERVVTVADGDEVRSRTVVVATGVSYRRLGIPSLDVLTGAGVFYGAATSEAKAIKDREVFVVGGANSAGQAAIHLARYAATVTMLVRGQSLADSMSEYLVKEITSTPNIVVRRGAVVTGGGGTGCLERLTVLDQASGVTETVPAAAVFVLIGTEPRTQWLPGEVRRDRVGVRGHRDRPHGGRASSGRLAAPASPHAPGVQPARGLRGGRRPLRVGETGSVRGRRGLGRDPPHPRPPARRLTGIGGDRITRSKKAQRPPP